MSTPTSQSQHAAPSSRASAHSAAGMGGVAYAAVQPLQLLSNENYHVNGSNTVIGATSVKESNGASATVAPADYDSGSGTNDAVRAVSQKATTEFGKKFIAGHMLNNHLGGTGTDQKNITAITAGQNSRHHANLEKQAKAEVKGGKTINYYTHITKRADFYNKAGTTLKATGLASELTGGYTIPATGASYGPIVLPLGPPAEISAKKSESGTGVGGGGGGGAAIAALTEIEEQYAEQADDIGGVLYGIYSATLVAAYPGTDDQDLKEVLVDILTANGGDVEKASNKTVRWCREVQDAVAAASALPAYLSA